MYSSCTVKLQYSKAPTSHHHWAPAHFHPISTSPCPFTILFITMPPAVGFVRKTSRIAWNNTWKYRGGKVSNLLAQEIFQRSFPALLYQIARKFWDRNPPNCHWKLYVRTLVLVKPIATSQTSHMFLAPNRQWSLNMTRGWRWRWLWIRLIICYRSLFRKADEKDDTG